ncbi:endonuclease/exonuclease/phosphatase family protein [Clostridium sp. Cult2]|uniref:endonuclease/exonuclease/phosphatase family protein n=1 Tax=Clostridium sp. Cult2 TaxID=2079003 RepID=UPI001F22FA1C|nr:endonuclease/exonuclease/phosphatase family protein [Clostridium sp. Cult2]MCF6464544.1 endonuclease/exonuclease/phosphatase [Clostridium sp. Cult2]
MCINVLTWNIKVGQNKEGGYPISKTENLDRIADFIRDSKATIICLQEVDAYTLRSGIKTHQAAYIANRLTLTTGKVWNYKYIVSKNMNPGYYGNAILSCYPMTIALKIHLPKINSKEDRSFLLANVHMDDFSIYIGTFHLGLQGDQIFQAQQIKNVLNNNCYFNERIILGGDLNTPEGSDAYNMMLNHGFPIIDIGPVGVCTLNCYNNSDNPKIDFLFMRELSTYNLRSEVLPVDISDHRPVMLYQC